MSDNNEVYTIFQVNLFFVADEDRLFFSMNTQNNQQFCFYFTRRWVKLFWPNLAKILEANMLNIEGVDKEAKDAAMAFYHESMLMDAEYNKPFITENMEHPWGATPLIATEIRLREPPNELPSIGIYAANGVGMEFSCDNKILHYLFEVLPKATEKAGWDIELTGFAYQKYGNVDISKLN